MSTVRISIDYAGRLWPADDLTGSLPGFQAGAATCSLAVFDASLALQVDLSTKTKRALFTALTKHASPQRPHWQSLPTELHSTVLEIERALRTAADIADTQLRQLPQALRLPPWSFPREPANSNIRWSSARWTFDDDDRRDLADLISQLDESNKATFSDGIWIPLPDAYEGRQVFIDGTSLDALRARTIHADPVPPSYALFASAHGQWENRAFAPAVAILAVALETALKWRLSTRGDKIAGYLLENVQSPPLPKLLACARAHAALDVPKHFQAWLEKLVSARNEIVHRPVAVPLDPLLVARWFSMSEAILGALAGGTSDAQVGRYIRTAIDSEAFKKGTRGVILRREETCGHDDFHILLESGVTRRFSTSAFEVTDD